MVDQVYVKLYDDVSEAVAEKIDAVIRRSGSWLCAVRCGTDARRRLSATRPGAGLSTSNTGA